MKKYEILENDWVEYNGKILYRIVAIIKFGDIKKGDLGGYIEDERNLSHDGDCWIEDNAIVLDKSIVKDDAIVCGNAVIEGNVIIKDLSFVEGEINLRDSIIVEGKSQISGNMTINGSGILKDITIIN